MNHATSVTWDKRRKMLSTVQACASEWVIGWIRETELIGKHQVKVY
jgi:hypothetical protein